MGVEYDGEIPGPEFFPVFPEKFKNRFLPGKVGVEGPRTPPGALMFLSRHGMVPHYHSRSFPGIAPLPSFPGNSPTPQFPGKCGKFSFFRNYRVLPGTF